MVDENRSDVFSPPLVVGFEDEAVKIMERLDGKPKSLDVISIVGMPGIGKTTLALKVYNDPYIAHQFYIRAWVSVSQVYNKRDLLLVILRSPHINPNQPDLSDEQKLKEALYKRLKGNKYLILLDDIWDIEAWEDLKRSFPNDNNGSRIMFTTRNRDVALRANSNNPPHDMGFLSIDDSWSLLKEKVFQNKICPPELMEVGKKIAKNCGGLPLALVTIGGLLAKTTEKTKQWWTQVGESIASYLVSDSNHHQVTKTLELSYNHLPDHLKPLFLYFGAFPEDYEIHVSKMILLWIGEGFIKKESGGAAETTLTIEDVAERYLMDLIERSLILIANTRSDGRVKSCRIHDLLRDLCIVKAEEENFMHIIHRFEDPFFTSTIISSSISTSFSSSSPIGIKFNRLSITNGTFKESPFHHHYQNICSLLVFPAANFVPESDLQQLKLLRVLDLSHYFHNPLPSQILGQLVHLRYLVSYQRLPKSVFKLKNLEVLIFGDKRPLNKLDIDISQMTKLRHLHIGDFDTSPSLYTEILADLQSISTPTFLNSDYTLLLATPNLRKLKCMCDHHYIGPIRELGLLEKLEKLDMFGCFYVTDVITTIMPFDLPASLKQVTLALFQFDWKEISKLARLPNLEVLKLLGDAFKGNLWDTSLLESIFEPFPKLKFLKFDSLDIVQWNIASVDHFPTLERLVVTKCCKLKEIPSDLGDILTLKTIHVDHCRPSVKRSARKILEEQRDKGNDQLEIFVGARRLMVSHSSCSTGSNASFREDEDEDEDEDERMRMVMRMVMVMGMGMGMGRMKMMRGMGRMRMRRRRDEDEDDDEDEEKIYDQDDDEDE